MSKCSLSKYKKKILQLPVLTCMYYAVSLKTILVLIIYNHAAFNYPHIPEEKVQNELYWETNPNLVKKSKVECKYDQILTSTKTTNSWEVDKRYDDFVPSGIANGSYVPEHCNPAFSVAILVTYRNRQKHLDIFLPYMHNFLRRQNIHYKIYIIEQKDENPWNKGLLYNVGAKQAIADKFPCLVLHDVDLLPLDERNLYACARRPRHMSASIDKFRYVLPYGLLVGGVLAIRADHFLALNGFSDQFQGWGGEDDDFYFKIMEHNLSVLRFPRSMSRYAMLRHAPAPPNPQRHHILAQNRRPAASPRRGAGPRALRLARHRLFTWLAVST